MIIGSVLYPDAFSDIDPAEKADEIYEFLTEKQVFSEMQNASTGTAERKYDMLTQH